MKQLHWSVISQLVLLLSLTTRTPHSNAQFTFRNNCSSIVIPYFIRFNSEDEFSFIPFFIFIIFYFTLKRLLFVSESCFGNCEILNNSLGKSGKHTRDWERRNSLKSIREFTQQRKPHFCHQVNHRVNHHVQVQVSYRIIRNAFLLLLQICGCVFAIRIFQLEKIWWT